VRFLTTGTQSGFGKHIYEIVNGISWTRQLPAESRKEIKYKGVDVIIHCASNSCLSVNSDNLYTYMADNVLLTEELISTPHQKFIFFSSVDIYPRQGGLHSENELINVNAVSGIYGITKLMSESIVRRYCPNYLILRCASLLGKYSRKNNLIRIIVDNPCAITLSGDSQLNYVLHSDVSDFILFAIKNDIQGIYNVSSIENITLLEVADMVGKKVNFGRYHYNVGEVDNNSISSVFPAFKKTSREVIVEFILKVDIGR